jgi:hypothetical protein
MVQRGVAADPWPVRSTALGAVAELERAKIIERTTRGRLHRLRMGELSSNGHRIYGYHYVKKSPTAPAALVHQPGAGTGRPLDLRDVRERPLRTGHHLALAPLGAGAAIQTGGEAGVASSLALLPSIRRIRRSVRAAMVVSWVTATTVLPLLYTSLWRMTNTCSEFECLAALEPVRDLPAEQARVLRLLIERIHIAPDGISVTLHCSGIRSLVAELASERSVGQRLHFGGRGLKG